MKTAKEKVRVTFLIDKSLAIEIEEYAKKHKISKSKVVEKAIRLLKQQEGKITSAKKPS